MTGFVLAAPGRQVLDLTLADGRQQL